MREDWHDWRVLTSHKVIIALILIALMFILLLLYQLAHGRQVCRAPSVPVSHLDPQMISQAELDFIRDDGCATLSEDRLYHGVWVDTPNGGIFFPNVTTIPPGRVPRTNSWIYLDRATRAAIHRNLPAVDGTLGFQVIAISFYGSEYTLDRPTRDGLRRLFDVREVRSIRLLRRDYLSARTAPAG